MTWRVLLAAPLAFAGAVWFYLIVLPWPVTLRWRDPESTAFMRARVAQAESRGDSLALRYDFVPLDDISRHLRRAVTVAEDGNFERHNGIDWSALAEELHYTGDDAFSPFDPGDLRAVFGALRYYVRNREEIRGRSTITQQLAKNLYFSENRSVLRKFEELVVARRLERFLSKDRILELYLNTVELGPGIFGVQAAARHYFGTDADDVTRWQAASLAATLPHPLTSNPDHRPGRMAWRRNLILARMGGTGPVETVPLAPPEIATPDPVILGEPVDTMAPDTVVVDTVVRDTSITVSDTNSIHRGERGERGERINSN